MTKGEADLQTRRRIIANLREHMYKERLTAAAVSRMTKISEGALSRLLSEADLQLGIDILVKIHRGLHISANAMLDRDPPAGFFRPGSQTTGPGSQKSSPLRLRSAALTET